MTIIGIMIAAVVVIYFVKRHFDKSDVTKKIMTDPDLMATAAGKSKQSGKSFAQVADEMSSSAVNNNAVK